MFWFYHKAKNILQNTLNDVSYDAETAMIRFVDCS